jgi:hypothetical protein
MGRPYPIRIFHERQPDPHCSCCAMELEKISWTYLSRKIKDQYRYCLGCKIQCEEIVRETGKPNPKCPRYLRRKRA